LQDQTLFQPVSIENHPADSRVDIDDSGKVQTLTSRMGTGGGNVPMVMEPVTLEPGIAAREGGHIYEGVSGTLRAKAGDNQMAVAHPICIEGNGSRPSHKGDGYAETDTMYTLNTTERHAVVYGISPYHSNAWKSDNPHSGVYEADKSKTLDALQCGYPGCNQDGIAPTLVAKGPHAVQVRYIVRRLTPLECERLQGYPDGWTDIGEWIDSKGKKHKEADSPRYKASGNSIAIPPWKWVLKRLCACYERDATMASLFDGIGGFPYIWEQLNGKGSCLWASEIEEFCIAVTKKRFGD
jgi:hypothetical protein